MPLPESIQNIPQSVGAALQSEDVKKFMPYLLAGGLGAGLGAIATGGRRKRDGESRTGYLSRIIRNALLTGGLGAGATYAIRKGLENTKGQVDQVAPMTGSEGAQSPLATGARAALFSPVTAALAGGGTLAATHNITTLGANTTGREKALNFIRKSVDRPSEDVTGMARSAPKSLYKEFLTKMKADHQGMSPEVIRDMTRRKLSEAGLSMHAPAGDLLGRIIRGSRQGKPIIGAAKAKDLFSGGGIKGMLSQALDKARHPVATAKDIGGKAKDALQSGASKVRDAAANPKQTATALGGKAKSALGEAGSFLKRDAVARASGVRGIGSRAGRGIRTFGQTPGTAAKRLLLGGGAALLPAFLGSYLTDPVSSQY